MDDLLKDYFLKDEAQQKCISAAIGQSHEYCMRASQLMKVAHVINAQAAIVTQIDFSDSSHSYVILELRFYYIKLDTTYFTIFKTVSIQNTQNIGYSFASVIASATLDLTREDFEQFESIIKPILDTAFTTTKNFLDKKDVCENKVIC